MVVTARRTTGTEPWPRGRGVWRWGPRWARLPRSPHHGRSAPPWHLLPGPRRERRRERFCPAGDWTAACASGPMCLVPWKETEAREGPLFGASGGLLVEPGALAPTPPRGLRSTAPAPPPRGQGHSVPVAVSSARPRTLAHDRTVGSMTPGCTAALGSARTASGGCPGCWAGPAAWSQTQELEPGAGTGPGSRRRSQEPEPGARARTGNWEPGAGAQAGTRSQSQSWNWSQSRRCSLLDLGSGSVATEE